MKLKPFVDIRFYVEDEEDYDDLLTCLDLTVHEIMKEPKFKKSQDSKQRIPSRRVKNDEMP